MERPWAPRSIARKALRSCKATQTLKPQQFIGYPVGWNIHPASSNHMGPDLLTKIDKNPFDKRNSVQKIGWWFSLEKKKIQKIPALNPQLVGAWGPLRSTGLQHPHAHPRGSLPGLESHRCKATTAAFGHRAAENSALGSQSDGHASTCQHVLPT